MKKTIATLLASILLSTVVLAAPVNTELDTATQTSAIIQPMTDLPFKIR